MIRALVLILAMLAAPVSASEKIVATGDLGVVIERATGSVLIIDQSEMAALARVEGLGDLSHASVVFSPDQRFAYIFGRDGGLTKLDLTTQSVAGRVLQSGNAIGGAISDDGRLVAVSNYEPGGVRVFDAESLDLVADIPTNSKTIGLVDAPGRRFVFSLWDKGETWIADMSAMAPDVSKFENVGLNPYDALITADGRHYIVGLFGERRPDRFRSLGRSARPETDPSELWQGRRTATRIQNAASRRLGAGRGPFCPARCRASRGALDRRSIPEGSRAHQNPWPTHFRRRPP